MSPKTYDVKGEKGRHRQQQTSVRTGLNVKRLEKVDDKTSDEQYGTFREQTHAKPSYSLSLGKIKAERLGTAPLKASPPYLT